MEITPEFVATIRKNIIELLQLVASRDEQNAYPVPAEWFCMWFDDSYHPDSPVHERAFSASERRALESFNERFEAVHREIGEPPADPAELWPQPVWQELMVKARETLLELAGVAEP